MHLFHKEIAAPALLHEEVEQIKWLPVVEQRTRLHREAISFGIAVVLFGRDGRHQSYNFGHYAPESFDDALDRSLGKIGPQTKHEQSDQPRRNVISYKETAAHDVFSEERLLKSLVEIEPLVRYADKPLQRIPGVREGEIFHAFSTPAPEAHGRTELDDSYNVD
jgi:hypothetical protein